MFSKALLIFILISLTTMGFIVLSDFSMSHADDRAPCPFSFMADPDCIFSSNPIAQIQHHVSGLFILSQAILPFSFYIWLLSFIWFITLSVFWALISCLYSLKLSAQKNYFCNFIISGFHKRILAWILRHIQRDPF